MTIASGVFCLDLAPPPPLACSRILAFSASLPKCSGFNSAKGANPSAAGGGNVNGVAPKLTLNSAAFRQTVGNSGAVDKEDIQPCSACIPREDTIRYGGGNTTKARGLQMEMATNASSQMLQAKCHMLVAAMLKCYNAQMLQSTNDKCSNAAMANAQMLKCCNAIRSNAANKCHRISFIQFCMPNAKCCSAICSNAANKCHRISLFQYCMPNVKCCNAICPNAANKCHRISLFQYILLQIQYLLTIPLWLAWSWKATPRCLPFLLKPICFLSMSK